jgi:Bacterial Ig-like domain
MGNFNRHHVLGAGAHRHVIGRTAVLLSLCLAFTACEPKPVSLSFTAPTDTVYVRGDSVTFQILATNADNAPVELLKDDVVLVSLLPPYTYVWDAALSLEGTYSFKARLSLKDTTVESEPRSVVIDRTGPKVVSQTPAIGTPEAKVTDTISLTFSETLKAESVSDKLVTVSSANVALTSPYSVLQPDLKTVRVVIPPGRLGTPSQVKLTIAPGTVTDLAGNPMQPLEDTREWTWIAAPDWQRFGEPLTVAVPKSDADAVASLAVGADGYPQVALSVADGGIAVQSWNGRAWQELPLVKKEPGDKYQTPRLPALTLDSAGVPYLAYVVDEAKDPNVPLKVLLDRFVGGAWQQVGAEAANERPIGNLQPEVEVARDGTVVVHYRGPDTIEPDRGRESAVRIWDGLKWVPKETLGDIGRQGAIYFGDGSVVTMRNSKPVVAGVYSERDRYLDLEMWTVAGWDNKGAAGRISAVPGGPATDFARPGIAVDAQDRALVAYHQSKDGRQFVNVQRWTDIEKNWEVIGAVSLPEKDPLVLVRPAIAVTRLDTLWMLLKVLEKNETSFRLYQRDAAASSLWRLSTKVPSVGAGRKLVGEPMLRLTVDGFPVTTVVSINSQGATAETFVWPSSIF